VDPRVGPNGCGISCTHWGSNVLRNIFRLFERNRPNMKFSKTG